MVTSRLSGSSPRAPTAMLRPPPTSERDLVAALEFQDLARLIGGRDVQSESFDDLSNLRYLIGIGWCEPSGADPEAVFQSHPADPAQQAKDGLNEQRSLHQSFGPEVMQIVEVTGVIAFELIAGVRAVERFQ